MRGAPWLMARTQSFKVKSATMFFLKLPLHVLGSFDIFVLIFYRKKQSHRQYTACN